MRAKQLGDLATCLALFVCVVTVPHVAFAQDEDRKTSPLLDALKGTLIDPTTYIPAILGYDATMRDWKSSQPLFHYGLVEHNGRFTVSGRADDTPLNYGDGRTQVFKDALGVLAVSAIHNVAERLIENAFIAHHPTRHKTAKALGWIERISVAAALSYAQASPHYRQWRLNQQMAAHLGIG